MENEIKQLKIKIERLELLLNITPAGDRFIVQRHLQFLDGQNLQFATGTGTKIATGTDQKIGFYNTTPVAQASSAGETLGFTAGAGTAVKDESTFTGNVGSTAYRISDIVKHLKNLGLIAS